MSVQKSMNYLMALAALAWGVISSLNFFHAQGHTAPKFFRSTCQSLDHFNVKGINPAA
jgi:hypothetical protein